MALPGDEDEDTCLFTGLQCATAITLTCGVVNGEVYVASSVHDVLADVVQVGASVEVT